METPSFAHLWAILEDADNEGDTFRGHVSLVRSSVSSRRYPFSLTGTSKNTRREVITKSTRDEHCNEFSTRNEPVNAYMDMSAIA
jgi:hypothetical protein